MRKLIALFILAAVSVQAQVTNTVNISNSLLGPVTNIFTNVTIDATGEIVITGAVFNASITNEFSPINNITNINNIGETTVINSNTFVTVLTNEVNVAGVTVTNNVFVDNATYVTNLIDQFVGINTITPVVVSTNVLNTWTIDLTTNNPVGIYIQVANITSVVFNVESTNDVALGEVLLLATTNSITWPTNGLTWAAGAAPDLTASEYNRIYFEAWRNAVFGVYVGSNP